jgi:hypothetical protein
MDRIRFACQKLGLVQGCTNPGRQVTCPTEFYKGAPNISESVVWDLLHATYLALTLLGWILSFWKSLTPVI